MRYTQPCARASPRQSSAIARRSARARSGCNRRMSVQWRIMRDVSYTGSRAGGLQADRRRVRKMEGKDLRKVGLKVTLPRLKILEILERSSTRHLSAEDIYRSLLESNEDIGLATVYRVLTQFEAASLVTRHHFEDGMAVFELNEGTHHDHIVCLDCGRDEEFTEEGIEARQTAVAKRLGFEIRDHSLILYGQCRRPACPYRKKVS